MGYDISGFIADQRLTNDDIDQMFDGVEAEGITKFEGVTAGVVDVIRADAYTLGLGVLEDIGTATLNSGEFIRFTIGSTAGVYIMERFVDGEKTDNESTWKVTSKKPATPSLTQVTICGSTSKTTWKSAPDLPPRSGKQWSLSASLFKKGLLDGGLSQVQ